MNVQTTPALDALVKNTTDTVGSIANFMVDNNEQAVFAVLKANGYNFNTHGEAAIIVKSILLGTTDKTKAELQQLSSIPYLNNNSNGTGGLTGQIGGNSTSTVSPALVCTVSSLFGVPIGCDTQSQLTPEQLAAQQKAAQDAAKAKQTTTIIVISIVAVVILVIVVIYFKKKKS